MRGKRGEKTSLARGLKVRHVFEVYFSTADLRGGTRIKGVTVIRRIKADTSLVSSRLVGLGLITAGDCLGACGLLAAHDGAVSSEVEMTYFVARDEMLCV
jgi:hypothetical protein